MDEIQEVYRLQGVRINDKHVETIEQMLRRVQITDVGDTNFLVEEQVEKWLFEEENARVMNVRRPAVAQPLLLDNTKASLSPSPLSRHLRSKRPLRCLPKLHLGQNRLPQRLERKRHHGPSDPAGTGLEGYRNLSIETVDGNDDLLLSDGDQSDANLSLS